ncbi:MAG: PEP-CTERM sorting domain-containing protein, partial [Verrucomicrobiota bacterium]
VANGNTLIIRGGGSLVLSDAANQEAWIGHRSDGTMRIESGSYSSTGQQLRLSTNGNNNQGHLVIGDGIGPSGDATFTLNGDALQVKQGNNTGAGFLTINTDGQVSNTRLLVGNGGDGTAVMNGNATFETNTGTGINYVGVNNNGTGSLTLNDNAVFTFRGTRGLRIGGQHDGAEGTMTLNGNSQFIGTAGGSENSDRGLVVGRGGDATLNINDNALINLASTLTVAGLGNNSAGDTATVNHNGGTVVTVMDLFVGRQGNANYTLTSGSVTARDLRLGYQSGTGTFTQNGGTVQLTGRDLWTGEFNNNTGDGVYNLLGGTLKVDNIDLDDPGNPGIDGVFNWGGGTLTMSFPNNKATPGTIDYTTTDPINGVGQIVRSGTTIAVDGDLSTGFGGATSVLDLGGLYIDDGTRVDIMEITGTLDLSGADHLISVDSPNLLRPIGGSAIDYGSIPLVTATGGITGGSFNSFAAPMADARPFYASPFAVSDPANLKPNTFYIETTGDTVWFHYKVTGTVPEPGTGLLFGLGVLMVRGLHRLRRKDPA